MEILLDGAKLAGVLIDSSLAPAGTVDWVVIGIGVNIAQAPDVPGRGTACLAQAGVSVAPEELARSITAQIDRWRAAPFFCVKDGWLRRGHPVGTALRVHNGAEMIQGVFAGLSEDGKLRLEGQADSASGDVEIAGG